MRGIDEETLIAVRKSLAAEKLNTDVIDALISLKIRELNTWLPIDENTPKDRELLLYWKTTKHKEIAFWSHMCGQDTNPTHYQELPDDPESGDAENE